MTDKLNKLTFGHFVYVMAAGAAVGFLFVLLDNYVITKAESLVGITPTGAVV